MTEEPTEELAGVPVTLHFPTDRVVGQLTNMGDRSTTDAIGDVKLSPAAPSILTITDTAGGWLLGTDLPGVIGVVVAGARLTSADARKLLALPGLVQFVATGDFTDDDLAGLSSQVKLQALVVDSPLVHGDFLPTLRELPALRQLVVTADSLGPGSLAVLSGTSARFVQVQVVRLDAGVLTPPPVFAPGANLTLIASTIDRDELTALLAANPELKGVGLYLPDGSNLLAPEHEVELRRAYPNLEINRAWFANPETAEARAIVPGPADESIHPLELTADGWEQAIASEQPTLVDFWAEWCGPCKQIAPVIHALSGELVGQVTVAKLDVEAHPGISERYGIMGIPTLLVFKGGELVGRIGSQTHDGILSELASAIA